MHNPSRRWLIAAVAAGALMAAVVIVFSVVRIPITPYVEDKLKEFARDRFDSDLEFSRIDVSPIPVSIRVEKLVFRHKGRRDVPPLIQIEAATARIGIRSLLSIPFSTPAVDQVRLEGLEIHVSRRKDGEPEEQGKEPAGSQGSESPDFVIEELIADGTRLRILPKDPGKEPLEFDLKSLRMESVALVRPMHFVAELTNAKPPGLIQTEGDFGPWSKDDPGLTPVKGEYTFDHADLGDFKGIGGILSSVGRYEGELARIVVDGTTDTPDFHVDIAGHPVHLKTEFHAIVDGTNGDTLLEPVIATWEKSTVTARGGVYGMPGMKGKTVRLDVDVDDGRIEDMMKFAIKSDQPILQGPIRYQAKLEIPPGKDLRVVEKLKLDGQFKVSQGKFTSDEVKQRLGSLSNKAQGEPDAPVDEEIASDFSGHFRLDSGLLFLPDLAFQLPGANVRLKGSYHLISEKVDFEGVLRLDAKVSETTTGIKSFFLKLADPLFNKNGGSEIPIKIQGQRSDPKYGVNIGEVLK